MNCSNYFQRKDFFKRYPGECNCNASIKNLIDFFFLFFLLHLLHSRQNETGSVNTNERLDFQKRRLQFINCIFTYKNSLSDFILGECYDAKNCFVITSPCCPPEVAVAFSSHARILGECSTIHSPPSIFFKVEISSCTLIPLLFQDQSTVAQRAETTVAECFLTSCV